MSKKEMVNDNCTLIAIFQYRIKVNNAMNTISPEIYDAVTEVVASINYMDDVLNEIGLDMSDFIGLSEKDEAFYESLQDYLDNSGEIARTLSSSESSGGLTASYDNAHAKASALTYATKVASWSVVDDGRGLDVNQKAVYMFLSHYIDKIGSTYWNTMNYGLLVDGPSSSEGGHMAKYITDYDRDTYDIYLSKLANINANEKISNASAEVLSLITDFSLNELTTSARNLKNSTEQMKDGCRILSNLYPALNYSVTLAKTANVVRENYNGINSFEELDSLIYTTVYDKYSDIYTGTQKDIIIDSFKSIIAAAILGTSGFGMLGGLLGGASISGIISAFQYVNATFGSYLHYVAWLSLSLNRQSRISYRYYRSWGMM